MPINTSKLTDTIAGTALAMKHFGEQEAIKAETAAANESAAYAEYHTRNAEFDKLTSELEGTDGLNDKLNTAKAESEAADKKLADYETKLGIAPTPEQKVMSAVTGEPIKQDLSKLTKGQSSYLTRLQRKKESMNKAFESLSTEVNSKQTQLGLIEKRMSELNKKYNFEGGSK